MCRWLAYWGSPIRLTDVLYTPVHSIIDQSLHSKLGAETTNGDGFGIGWYDGTDSPGVFHSTEPAWNDTNLREVSAHTTSPLFFAHIRAAIGSAVQQSNCHPFRYRRWLWMHNGFIDGLGDIKRELSFEIDPALWLDVKGTTDTELMFYLALTYGLEDDPPGAVARMIGFVEARGREHGHQFPFQGTIATSNGDSLWAFRYSSVGRSRSLYFNRSVPQLRELFPDRAVLREAADRTRLVVSEPIGDLPGAWVEVPEATYGVVGQDQEELVPFTPRTPA
ncbi:class II glutamine amidotransferase [Kitasatospora sp. NPDC085464]|uniref:class II glutamine amidotransferase n=1 Tax=Kitasatospora sp. NPDC085464 TaxID=3364063 RepID=UPI0037C936CD